MHLIPGWILVTSIHYRDNRLKKKKSVSKTIDFINPHTHTHTRRNSRLKKRLINQKCFHAGQQSSIKLKII